MNALLQKCFSLLISILIEVEAMYSFDDSVLIQALRERASRQVHPDAFTTFMDCFRVCTQLKTVHCEGEMPQTLCEQCCLELGIAWNFIHKAIHSDQVLRDTLEKLTKYDERPNSANVNHSEYSDLKPLAMIKEKESINICENEIGPEVLITSQQFKAGDVVVFCDECNIYYDSKSEHFHHDGSLAPCIDEYEEKHLSKTIDLDLSQSNAQQDEIIISDLIENDELYVMDVLSADMNNINQYEDALKDSGQACDKDPNENNIDNILKLGEEIEKTAIYCCPTCFETFETCRALQHHSRIHSVIDDNVTICKICNQEISKGETVRKHLRNFHSKTMHCTQCNYRGPEYKMSDHIQCSHTEPKICRCKICDKSFCNQGLLNSHLKYHQRKEANIKSDACETCGKQFSTQYYLRLHMEVHRNERQLYQCDHCEKIYVSKIAFENHIRLHRGETIKCDQCGKQFVRQYELNVHMRFHTRDYPFKCEICEKKFAIKGHLRTHMWRHQGLKLQCEECGKLFTSTKALQEHSFVHSEMPYPCTYCGRGYPSKQKFKVHLKTAHLVELTEEELLKITKLHTPKPLQRKKLTLVQADSVMKEIEVKDSEEETATEGDLLFKLS